MTPARAPVTISIALQCGVSAETLARSVGRLPASPVIPAELDHARGRKVPASPIGAALDLITAFENEAAGCQSPQAKRRRHRESIRLGAVAEWAVSPPVRV